MRNQFSAAMVERAARPNMVFITGDLGFMALEPLQEKLGARFINAGISEQNMVSVAAAMAKEGLEPWVYSIAPFCYARPFEQIRNDIAFHNLPVKLIGNGGGYAYGVMGPTHHAIEDYGVMLTLPNMRAYVPAFDEDIPKVIELVGNSLHPSYLRLGRGEIPADFTPPTYSAWRQLTQGGGIVVIVIGPLVGTYIDKIQRLANDCRPNLWVVSELPLDLHPLPSDLVFQISEAKALCVVEEHVSRGGLGSEISMLIAKKKINPKSFYYLHAQAHHYSTYGSQNFLRKKSNLDVESLLEITNPNN